MLILLSPAKTMDFKSKVSVSDNTTPIYIKEANKIASTLKKLNPSQIGKLMEINSKLAYLNYERFQSWSNQDAPQKQAILSYKGEVYNGLKANEWSSDDLVYSNEHIRILSGMYGILRPLDMIKPYRLEMGTRISIEKSEDLYTFWEEKVSKSLQDDIISNKHKYIINLASREYSNVINLKSLGVKIITPIFKEYRNGSYRFITVYGKNARGAMTRWIIRNRIQDLEALKTFEDSGYLFNQELSNSDKWCYTR